MRLSDQHGTVFFTKLLTKPGYTRQGIGTLVVTLGILFAVNRGATFVRLGEPEPRAATLGVALG